jgi:hypothetical protein
VCEGIGHGVCVCVFEAMEKRCSDHLVWSWLPRSSIILERFSYISHSTIMLLGLSHLSSKFLVGSW